MPMKKVVFVIIGIMVITAFTKHMMVSAISADLPENRAELANLEGKIEKLNQTLESLEATEKAKSIAELEILDEKRILLSYNISSSQYYVDIGMIKLIYVALKTKFGDKDYFYKQYYQYIHERMKVIDPQFCSVEFKEGFAGFIAAMAGSNVKEAEKQLGNLFKIAREKQKGKQSGK